MVRLRLHNYLSRLMCCMEFSVVVTIPPCEHLYTLNSIQLIYCDNFIKRELGNLEHFGAITEFFHTNRNANIGI